jgi:hypothetical protein
VFEKATLLEPHPIFSVPPAEPTPPDLSGLGDTEAVPTMSRCELDPEMYRIFAYAVLGWHRRLPKAGGDVCQCGKSWQSCEYVSLADQLLWTTNWSWRIEPG